MLKIKSIRNAVSNTWFRVMYPLIPEMFTLKQAIVHGGAVFYDSPIKPLDDAIAWLFDVEGDIGKSWPDEIKEYARREQQLISDFAAKKMTATEFGREVELHFAFAPEGYKELVHPTVPSSSISNLGSLDI
jgi:hypothetical protein